MSGAGRLGLGLDSGINCVGQNVMSPLCEARTCFKRTAQTPPPPVLFLGTLTSGTAF